MTEVEICHPRELGPPEFLRWSEIQRSRPEWANPFLSSGFALAMATARGATRVAVLREAGHIVGFFAFEAAGRGRANAVGLGLSDAQAVLIAPEVRLDFDRLLAACRISVLHADHLDDRQATAHAVRRGQLRVAPWADLSSGFDRYLAQRTAEHRKYFAGIRSRIRKLEREVGPVRLAHGPAESGVLDQLMRWKSTQYRQTGRPDRFARRANIELVESLAEADASQLAGVTTALWAGERLVAADFSLRYDTTVAGWFCAFDREFSRYSPGSVRTLLQLEAAAGAGVTRFELGRGEESYKRSLATDEDQLFDGFLYGRTTAAAMYRIGRAPVDAAMSTVLGHPVLRNVARVALRRLGSARTKLGRPVSRHLPDHPAS